MSDTTSLIDKRKRLWIITAIGILAVMVNIDFTAVNLALVPISKDLNANLSELQWVLSGYVLAWAAFVVPSGNLTDIFGRRRLFLIGTVLFALSSLVCGFAVNVWMIDLSRFAQGIGGALFVPALYGLIFTKFPKSQQGLAIGVIGGACGLGQAIGPTLGGVIIHLLSWRWIFFVNIPLCLVSYIIVAAFIEKEPKRLMDKPVDYLGIVTLSATLILLLFALNMTQAVKVDYSLMFTLFALSLLSLIAFAAIQLHKKYPMVEFGIFRNPVFLGCCIVYIFLSYNFASVLIIMGLYLQNIYSLSAFDAGMVFFAMTLIFGLLSPFGGKLADIRDVRIPIVIGMAFVLVAGFLFSRAVMTYSLIHIIILLFLVGFGLGLAFPALNSAMLKTLKESEINVGSGVFTLFGCLSNAVGLAISSVMLIVLGRKYLFTSLHDQGIQLNSSQIAYLDKLMAQTHLSVAKLAGVSNEISVKINAAIIEAYKIAMSDIMIVLGSMALVGVVLALTMIRQK